MQEPNIPVSEEPQVQPPPETPTERFQLLHLFMRPTRFFQSEFQQKNSLLVFFFVWMLGVYYFIDSLEWYEIYLESANQPISHLFFMSQWSDYWLVALSLGLITGVPIYFALGLWYRIRLRFCGVKNIPFSDALRVFVYSYMILVLPMLFVNAWEWLLYSKPADARDSVDVMQALKLPIIFVCFFWSLYISYRGVRVCFEARKWAARFWFLFMPIGFYPTVAIAFGISMAMLVTKPNVEHPQTFSQYGFSFQHPSNWEVGAYDEEDSIYVSMTDDSYLSLFTEAPIGSAKQHVEAFMEEYEDMQAQRTEKTIVREWGNNKGFGYRYRYIEDDSVYTVTLFAGEPSKKTFLLYLKVWNEQAERIQPGIDLIQKSFRYRTPEEVAPRPTPPQL